MITVLPVVYLRVSQHTWILPEFSLVLVQWCDLVAHNLREEPTSPG